MKLTIHIFLIAFLNLATVCFCFAQLTFQINIKSNINNSNAGGLNIFQTNDKGFVLTGFSVPSVGSATDLCLIKTDSIGDTLWTKTYGTTGYDEGFAVALCSDGGYIVTGYMNDSNTSRTCLIKTDEYGNLHWSKTIDGSFNNGGTSIKNTSDGGFILAGISTDTLSVRYDYLTKIDSVGNILWNKTFGLKRLEGKPVAEQTSDGGYILGGSYEPTNAYNYIYLIKTDVNGDTLWTTSIELHHIWLKDLHQTNDGGFIITGYTQAFLTGNIDACLVKTDSMGNVIWSKIFGGSGIDKGYSLQETFDGGYLIAGHSDSYGNGFDDVYLIKTNNIGDTLWTKIFGGIYSEYGYSVIQTMDSSYAVTGVSLTLAGPQVFLLKTDANGNTMCNESTTTTLSSTITTNNNSPIVNVSSSILTSNNYNFTIGNLSTVTDVCLQVGVQKNDAGIQPFLSPNPTSGNFTITFTSTINKGSIGVYNTIGTKLYSQNIVNANTTNIQLQNFAKGIYFVQVNDGEKQFCKKIIIE